jgi:hypothetical protein
MPASQWVEATGRCNSLVTGINIELFTKKVGAAYNPQQQILYAVASYSTATWRFPSTNRSSTHRFPVTASVTFVPAAMDEVEEYVPGAPPLFPRFPRDLLYPLYIDTNTAYATAHPAVAALAASAMLALSFVW